MHGTKRWMMLLAALLLVVPACTSNSLDDGDSADVVLEVVSLDNPPVAGEIGEGGFCGFTVESWTASLANIPKNRVSGEGTSPYNDIVVNSLVIAYEWIDCASCSTVDRFVGLGNVSVPAGGLNAVTFEPIALDDVLNGLPDIEGSTANLTLTFTAQTVEGTVITERAYRQLHVESCI